MTDDSGSSEQNQSGDLEILSSLLLKERLAENSENIKGILSSDKNLHDKITLIKDLDKKSKNKRTAPASLSHLQKKTLPEKKETECIIDIVSKEAAEEVKNHRHRITQNRKMLKPHIEKSTFFKFLFTERKKIRNFADKTGLITFKVFSPNVFLNPAVLKKFPDELQTIALELTVSLKKITDMGWHYLDKRDYNLLILLHKLCRELTLINFSSFNRKSQDLINRMIGAELLFLIINYECNDIKELIHAVDMVFHKDPSKKKLQKETAYNIQRLLDQNQMRPSLYNFIIALNIIQTRTFLKLGSLQQSSLQLIDNHDYNCKPEVREKITEYLQNLEKGIQPFLDNEKEVYRLHAFVPTDGKGVVDFSQLQQFYDSVLHLRRLTFDNNKDNIIKLMINLAYAFLISFREILSESVKLENKVKAHIFAQPIFGQDISRIELNLGKLDKIQTVLPKFATSRCISIKKAMSGAIDSEAQAMHAIFEITSSMTATGKRLAHILRKALPLSSDKSCNRAIPFFSFDEITYNIPYQNKRIVSEGFLENATVKEALFKITGICYQTGAFMQYGELSELLSKEKQIHDGIRVNVKHYKRIAHEKVFKAFIEKYNLPLIS